MGESRVVTLYEATLCGEVREGVFEEITVDLRLKFHKLKI